MSSLGCRQLATHRTSCVAACAAPSVRAVGPGRVAWRAARLLISMAVATPPALLVMALPGYGRQKRRSAALGRLSRQLLGALDIRVTVTGTARTGPSLVVANHTSWLDLLLLTAAAPMVPVAKSEVAEWPLVGAVARRCGAVFLRRDSLRALPGSVDEVALRLRQGHRVQIFPEATTRCGRAVGEFHRAGFQAALDAAVVVQPAAIRYASGGRPTTTTSFVGDETLVAAALRVLRMPDLHADLRWLTPIPAVAGTGRAAVDRATVTRLVQNAIARSLGQPVLPRRNRVVLGIPVARPESALVRNAA